MFAWRRHGCGSTRRQLHPSEEADLEEGCALQQWRPGRTLTLVLSCSEVDNDIEQCLSSSCSLQSCRLVAAPTTQLSKVMDHIATVLDYLHDGMQTNLSDPLPCTCTIVCVYR